MVQGNFQPAGASVQALSYFSPSRQNYLTGISPAILGVENVLATYTLPAGYFNSPGQEVVITMFGSFVANANLKGIKIIWGATTAVVGSTVVGGVAVAMTGQKAFNTANTGFSMQAIVAKVGNVGSNTQLGKMILAQAPLAAPISIIAPTFPTADETQDIIIACTGNAGTALTDILLYAFEVYGR